MSYVVQLHPKHLTLGTVLMSDPRTCKLHGFGTVHQVQRYRLHIKNTTVSVCSHKYDKYYCTNMRQESCHMYNVVHKMYLFAWPCRVVKLFAGCHQNHFVGQLSMARLTCGHWGFSCGNLSLWVQLYITCPVVILILCWTVFFCVPAFATHLCTACAMFIGQVQYHTPIWKQTLL